MKPEKTNGATVPSPAPAANGSGAGAKSVSEAFAHAPDDESAIAGLLTSGGYVEGPEPGGEDAADADEPEADEAPDAAEEPDSDETETAPEDAHEADPEEQEQETEADEEVHGLDPKIQARINKRIGKEVAKRKELEATLETERQAKAEAEAKLAELEAAPTPAAVRTDAPLEQITTAAGLQAKADEAEGLLEWVETRLDELDSDPEGVAERLKEGKVTLPDYEPSTMKRWLASVRRNVDRTIRVHIPQREKFLQRQTELEKKTVEEFAFWRDPKSTEFKRSQEVLKALPFLKGRADSKFIATAMVKGLEAIEKERAARQAAPAAAARSKTPPRVPGARKTAPTAPDPGKASRTAARKRFEESGSDKDLTSVIADLID